MLAAPPEDDGAVADDVGGALADLLVLTSEELNRSRSDLTVLSSESDSESETEGSDGAGNTGEDGEAASGVVPGEGEEEEAASQGGARVPLPASPIGAEAETRVVGDELRSVPMMRRVSSGRSSPVSSPGSGLVTPPPDRGHRRRRSRTGITASATPPSTSPSSVRRAASHDSPTRHSPHVATGTTPTLGASALGSPQPVSSSTPALASTSTSASPAAGLTTQAGSPDAVTEAERRLSPGAKPAVKGPAATTTETAPGTSAAQAAAAIAAAATAPPPSGAGAGAAAGHGELDESVVAARSAAESSAGSAAGAGAGTADGLPAPLASDSASRPLPRVDIKDLLKLRLGPFTAPWLVGMIATAVSLFGLARLLAMAFYLILFVLSFVVCLGVISWGRVRNSLGRPPLHPRRGVPKIVEAVEHDAGPPRLDKRLTGYRIIDEVLQEVLALMFRDYVEGWFKDMSDDPEFLIELRQSIQSITISIAARCKEFDWVNFVTVVAVDVLVKHIELFVRAQARSDEMLAHQKSSTSKLAKQVDAAQMVENAFFDLDPTFKAICTEPLKEKEYTRDLAEVLLFLMVRPEDFHNGAVRYLSREVVAQSCLLPMFDMLADPDYTNQSIALFTDDSFLTYQALLDVIKVAELDEVDVIVENLELDLQAKLESGSGTIESNTARFSAQIGALHFAKRECEARRKELGVTGGPVPAKAAAKAVRDLPFRFVLGNSTALTYFMEYMGEVDMGHLLDFYLTASGYHTSAKTTLEALEEFEDLESRRQSVEASLKAHASEIYSQYLDANADFRVPIPSDILSGIKKHLVDGRPKPTVFTKAKQHICDLMERTYYPKYKKSDPYYRCLFTLDFTEEELGSMDLSDDDEDGSETELETPTTPTRRNSAGSRPAESPTKGEDFKHGSWRATIVSADPRKDGGKTYTLYTIEVTFMSDRTEKEHQWQIERRFSEFHALHIKLKEQFAWVVTGKLVIPPKRAFGNHSKEVLEKRQQALDAWLEMLITPQIVDADARIRDLVIQFFRTAAQRHETQSIRSRAKSFLRPRKGSTASSKSQESLSSLPESATVTPLSENLGEDIESSEREPETDSIALRILLLLTEQIFELRGNQWLRRRIIAVLRSNIRGWLGDRINAKVVETINHSTSAEQVAGYVTVFRDSFWPNGVLAPESSARSQDCRVRTRTEAKAKLFGLIPDELKRVVGNVAAKNGMARIFSLFQHEKLNRRLVHVLAQALLKELFPDNNFGAIFTKLLDAANRPDAPSTPQTPELR